MDLKVKTIFLSLFEKAVPIMKSAYRLRNHNLKKKMETYLKSSMFVIAKDIKKCQKIAAMIYYGTES